MDTRQLRYFVKVYEERHLSRAADLCNISQSAVSLQITKLEEEFGTKLFIRETWGMQPTASGELLYRHAVPLLRNLAVATEAMHQRQGEMAGDYSIGLAYSVVKVIGADLMRTTLENHPRLRLSLTESVPSSTLLHMMQTELDIAMTFNPPALGELTRTPLVEEPLVCVGLPSFIGDTDQPISLDEVLRLPLVMYRQFSAPSVEASVLREINARARVRINSFQAIGQALSVGHGCFIGSKLYTQELVESGIVAMRPIADAQFKRTLCLVELAERPETFVTEMMRKLLVQLVRKAVEDGRWEADLIADATAH
ncbi:LysR family transcriptional regulator [Sinorhizobium mexicanum]|uniref:LysR family transcriptional regulator n=1 Tax=Sinorhizobium mexicanum TaxID=375549 RepID=A0A859R448_9HYPH|nr:LysR family transcriptional regulator [Sinorhizobium mexicanum]MBP1888082.1 LysR family nitrogen assimilation transcriptional regulator [Sinorhizobium mexicanum]QLL65691.1 LysR family transcriptional regulator [Sinorhizobium mexicanum]